MKQQFLPAIALLSLLSVQGYAQSELTIGTGPKFYIPSLARTNTILRLDYDSFDQNDLSTVLERNGITSDEKSKIYLHEENSYVDLHCFDCIIEHKNYDDEIASPDNELLKQK